MYVKAASSLQEFRSDTASMAFESQDPLYRAQDDVDDGQMFA